MKRIIAITMIVIMAVSLSACAKYDDNIENYYNDVNNYEADLFMPDLDVIGDYSEIEYLCKKSPAFFPEYSIQLIVKYEEKSFSEEKERLETAYSYIDEPQYDIGGDYTIPVEMFSLNSFNFRIAKFENTVYPKNFGMVGISDEKHMIAYLWSYCPDLDIICESDEDRNEAMLEFVNYSFSLG